jgi:hypothetical protein
MLLCSEWWIKEQARNHRIPYSWIGGSYLFTDQHIADIVRLFEVQPTEIAGPAPAARLPRKAEVGKEAGMRLVARTPRRALGVDSGRAA